MLYAHINYIDFLNSVFSSVRVRERERLRERERANEGKTRDEHFAIHEV